VFVVVIETMDGDPEVLLKMIIRLAELCMDVLQQNEEYHYEVRGIAPASHFFSFCQKRCAVSEAVAQ